MTTAHDRGSFLKKNIGRWGLLASLAAASLFGARPAEAANVNLGGVAIGTQSSIDCAGTTNTTVTFPVTVSWTGTTGTPTVTLAFTSATPPTGVTSQSISPSTITYPSTGPVTATFTITSPDVEVAQSTNFTITGSGAGLTTKPSPNKAYVVNSNGNATAGVDQSTCLNQSITLNGSALPGGFTGLWTIVTGGATGNFSSATTRNSTFTPTNNGGGTTTLRWTVTNGTCSSFDDMIVTVNALPATPTITPSPTSVCASSTGNTASGPAGFNSYAWSITNGTITGGAGTQTITYTAGATGSVTLKLIVTDANGCSSAQASTSVTINARPTASASGTTSICTGGSTALSGSGGVSCAWSPATGLDNASSCTPSASPSSTTTYNLTVTDANGCTSTNAASATITVNPIPNPPGAFTTSTASVCQGDTNVAYSVGTSSTSGVTYHWTYDGTGATFQTNDAGAANNNHVTFSASATSGTLHVTAVKAGCSSTEQTFAVTVNTLPATPTITPGSSSVCAGSTGNTASGPAGATTYAWAITNGSITSATNIQTITYTANASGNVTLKLTVTNAAGCSSAQASTLVPINPNPTANAGADKTTCLNSAVALAATTPGTGNTGLWTISTGGATGTFSDATSPTSTFTPTNNGGSVTVLTWTVTTTATGCSGSNNMNVTVNAIPNPPGVFTTSSANVCQGDANVVYNVGTSSTGGVTYHWTYDGTGATFQKNDAADANNNHVTFSSSATSGTLHVTAVKTGCVSSEQTFAVTVNPLPSATVTPGAASACYGSTGNTASVPDAGAGATYVWTVGPGGNTLTGGQGTNSITWTADTAGAKATLSVVVTNSFSCSTNGTVDVPLIGPAAKLSKANPLCIGNNFVLGYTGSVTNMTCSWTASPQPGSGVAAGGVSDPTCSGVTVTPTVSGTYTYTLTATSTTVGCSRITSDVKTLEDPVSGTGIITGPAHVCANSTGNAYSVTGFTNQTKIHWTVPAGASVTSGQDNPAGSVLIKFGTTSGNVVATPSDSCGNGTPATFAVTIDTPVGAAGSITGPAVICDKFPCSNASFAAASGSPYSTGTYPWTDAAGDFNGDGNLDLAVANAGGNSVSILLGDGTGNFSPAPGSPLGVGSLPYSVAVGDFNGDGRPDLAVGNSGANNVSIFLGNGAGGFAAASGSPFTVGTQPFSIAVADFNGDGALDLAVANLAASGNVSILLGTGTGNFGPATNFAVGNGPRSIAVGDFNEDGKMDLATANGGDNTVSVLLGNGAGSFSAAAGSPHSVGNNPVFVAAGDFDGDGILDLSVANAVDNSISILMGDGAGGFAAAAGSPDSSGASPISIAIGDFNGDGKLDLAVANSSVSKVSILLGNGAGSFSAATDSPYSVGANPVFVLAGDFNGDGRPDLAAASSDANSVSILLDVCTTAYSTTSVTNATTYTWAVPAGATVASGQGTTSITVDWGSAVSGNVTMTPSNACGNGIPATRSVTLSSLGATGPIAGPDKVCAGSTGVAYSTTLVTNATTYTWTAPAGTTIHNQGSNSITIDWGGVPGSVIVTPGSASCTGSSASESVSVGGSIELITGASQFCADDAGGIATATAATTGTTHFQWGFRTVSGGPITPLAGHTNSSYKLQGADFPGAGSYYLVCTLYITGTECNTGSGTQTIVSNEVTITVIAPCANVPPSVRFFTGTTRNGTAANILHWVDPGAPANNVILQVGAGPGYPASPTSPAPLATVPVGTGTFTDSASLTFGNTYFYSIFGFDSVGVKYSGDDNILLRPFNAPSQIKWAFSTGGITLANQGIRPLGGTPSAPGAIYAVSNNRHLDAMNLGASGGDWPAGWTPFAMNGSAQNRPVTTNLKFTLLGGSAHPVLVGASDGRVYAFDGVTGALGWVSPVLGDSITASPTAMFNEIHGGAPDVVMVGANSSTGNKFYGLNIANGTILWTFDHSGANDIGVISGQALLDYTNNRVYFASRAGGSGHTVWALNMSTFPPALVWTADIGDVDSDLNSANSALYAGTTGGQVYALNPATGAAKWTAPWSTGDGPVKGLVFASGTKLFFSTTTQVNGINDNGTGTAPTAFWTSPVAVPSPSGVLIFNGRVYVGAGNGRVYSIDGTSATPAAPTTVQLGNPATPFQLGAPTRDTTNNLLHFGSEPGQVYSVSPF